MGDKGIESKNSKNPPPRPHQILRLDLTGPHIPILRALLDILHQLLLLILQLHTLTIEFSLRLLQRALVFSEPFCWGHSFAKGPFYYLRVKEVGLYKISEGAGYGERLEGLGRKGGVERTFMVDD